MLSNSAMTPTSRFSTRPLYLQVRDALATRIATGEWKPTAAIPNESDLAREFGVSSGTMRKALDLLETERLLTRRQGRGTFVNDQASDELAVRYSNIRAPDGERISGEVTVTEISEGASEPSRMRTLAAAPARARVAHPKGPPVQGRAVHGRGRLHAGGPVSRTWQSGRTSRIGSWSWRNSMASCSARARSGYRSGLPRRPSPRLCGLRPGRPCWCWIASCTRSTAGPWSGGWARGHFADKYYLAEIN